MSLTIKQGRERGFELGEKRVSTRRGTGTIAFDLGEKTDARDQFLSFFWSRAEFLPEETDQAVEDHGRKKTSL